MCDGREWMSQIKLYRKGGGQTGFKNELPKDTDAQREGSFSPREE